MNEKGDASEAIFQLINPEKSEKVYKKDAIKYIDEKIKGEDDHHLKDPKLYKPLLKALTSKQKSNGIIQKKDIDLINERYTKGHLPRLKHPKSDHACMEEDINDNIELSNKKTLLAKAYNLAVSGGNTIKTKAFNIASKAGRAWLISLIPTEQISTLTTFFLLTYVINAQFLSYFVPLTLLSVSVIVMFISTIRMLRGKQRFEEVCEWSVLLTLLPGTDDVNVSAAEKTYVIRHLSPYLQFICSLSVALFAYAARRDICFFNAELFVISFVLYISMVLVFKMYSNKMNIIILAAFFVASVLEGFNRFDGYFAGGILLSIPIGVFNASVNISLSVMIRCIGVVMIYQIYKTSKMADRLITLYTEIGPLFVCLLWWEFGTLFFAQSSIMGIVRACFELTSLIFALPVLTFILIYFIITFIISVNMSKIIMTAILVAIPFVYAKLTKTNVKKIFYDTVSNTAVQIILTVIIIVGIGIGMLYYNPTGLKVRNSGLEWKTYSNLCVQTKPWSNGNYAEISLNCEEFKGYYVHWNGVVKSVKLSSSENKLNGFLNNLPGSLANWILCVYGTPFPTEKECNAKETPVSKHLCGIARASRRKCHIFNYSSLKFTITVAMTNKTKFDDIPTVDLIVGNDFKDVVFSLKQGNKIGFEGKISARTALVEGHVLYEYRNESNEPEEHLRKIADIKQALDTQLRSASTFILRFLFFPFISFD